MPYYIVEKDGDKKIIEASTKSAAINHVVKNTITAKAASPADIVELMQSGIDVEKANAEDDAVEAAPEPVDDESEQVGV